MMWLVYASGVIGGALLSSLGFYVSKLRLTTITFCVAHAALAGAALAIVFNMEPLPLALLFSTLSGLILGYLLPRLSEEDRNNIAMMLFSLFNAIAILSIYLGNAVVLATARVGGILWGSILAVTIEKFFYLVILTMVFAAYLALFKKQLDAIVFDQRLAEAEGINVPLHSLAIITLVSIAIALMLKLVGGFLIFTLVYIPVLAANTIASSTDRQLAVAIALGVLSCLGGTTLSYMLDLPIGVSIALTASTGAFIVFLAAGARNAMLRRRAGLVAYPMAATQ